MPLPSENTLTASNWFKFRLFYPSFLLSASPSPLPGRRGKERPAAPCRGAALTAPSLAALSTCACPCRPRDLSRCRTPFHPLRPCAPPSRHGPRLGALAHRPAAAARPRLSGGQPGRHAQPVWALSAHKRGTRPSLPSAAAPLAGGPACPTRHRHGESSKAGRVARRREHPELGGVEQRGREGPVD